MSYLQQIIRVSDNHHVLPLCGDMKTDVHAFLSESLLGQTDEKLWQQAARSASTPGAIGMYLMPDTHLGYHMPVGGVLVTEDTILQAGSGYDISCGIVEMKVPGLTASDVADPVKRRDWINAVERRVASGVGSGRPDLMPTFSQDKVEEILRFGGKAIGVSTDLCERQFIPVSDDIDFTAIPKAHDRAGPQMGSVGGGNHFIESIDFMARTYDGRLTGVRIRNRHLRNLVAEVRALREEIGSLQELLRGGGS